MSACVDLGPINVSATDTRSYRAIELANGLQALLIHDATADKAAASLDVRVGSLSDPKEIQGLAHFLEHMLFLGTEKYPKEDEYSSFLSSHAGSSNAFTSDSHTNFYFGVSHEFLEPSLDRFAQFFISPLFDQSCSDRELQAVDSEHEKNLKQDQWRKAQLDRHTCDPASPFCHFATGSRTTLLTNTHAAGIDLRQALLDFHARHYSANLMTLAILGRESLDDLQALVLSKFSSVANTNATALVLPAAPYGPLQLARRIHMVPIRDTRQLDLAFVLPDETDRFEAQSGHYISHLVGHEGPGSLLSFLKEQGWATALMSASSSNMKKVYSSFKITVTLSESGLEHVEEIVCAFFQYIELLRREGVQEWIYRECQQLQAMSFRFKDKDPAAPYCTALAGTLRDYPPRHVLDHAYLMNDFRPDYIQELLSLLVPRRMRMWVIAADPDGKCTSSEPYYGTQYCDVPLEESFLAKLECPGAEPRLHLPPANEFIPNDFTLHPAPFAPATVPVLLAETPTARVWHKQDDTFAMPKANVKIALVSRMAYADPRCCNLTRLFLDMLKDSLAEFSYAADLAGLIYGLINTMYGLELGVTGFTDKLLVLVRAVAARLAGLQIDPQRFVILKEQYKRFLVNFKANEPHQRVMYNSSLVLSECMYSHAERLAELDDITAEMVQAFGPTLLRRVHAEVLVHGNVTPEESLALANTIHAALSDRGLGRPLAPIERTMLNREHVLPDGCFFSHTTKSEIHKTSAVDMLFQIGRESTQLNVLLELVEQILHVPFFSQLRTQEQLGYIVHSSVRRNGGVQYLRFVIQSDRLPLFLETRVFAFIQSLKGLIEALSEAQFADYVEAVCARKLEKPKNLIEETRIYWSEIASGFYEFDRSTVEVPALRRVTKADVLAFCDEYLVDGAARRRVISIRTLPAHGQPLEQEDPSVPIEDLARFKRGLDLYALPIAPACAPHL